MRLRPIAIVGSITVTLAIAACGGTAGGGGEADKDGTTILSDAIAATGGAMSAHLKANLEGTGFDGDINAGNYFGSFTADGNTLQLTIKGQQLWMKAPVAFWSKVGGEQAVASCFGDKWVSVPSDNKIASSLTAVQGFTDLKKFADTLNANGAAVDKGSTSNLNGTPVIELKGKDGSIFVATSGKPYIVEVKGSAGTPTPGGSPGAAAGGPITIDLTNYDNAPAVGPPTGSVDITATAQTCAAAGAATPSPSAAVTAAP